MDSSIYHNVTNILRSNKEYMSKEPKLWSCFDYSSYLYNAGVADYYYDLFNCIVDGKSIGFRCPSIDVSKSWAVDKKMLIHNCKFHKGVKHSKLDMNRPTATWVCPERSDAITQIPHRHTYAGSHIPITFDVNDKNAGIVEILKRGNEARIWHAEMSIFKNEFRFEKTYPEGDNETTMQEKWERITSHNLFMEFDTKEDSTGERKDIMTEGDLVIREAQKVINIVNQMLWKAGIEAYEWFFSGGGLYIILHRKLNDISQKNNRKSEWTNLAWFNNSIYKWTKWQLEVIANMKKEKVRFIDLDYKKQFVRIFLKAPFSIHRKWDRNVLPLTQFFGSNEAIDLSSSKWRKYIIPKNINPKFVNSMRSEIY